jgi:hypothetical protein
MNSEFWVQNLKGRKCFMLISKDNVKRVLKLMVLKCMGWVQLAWDRAFDVCYETLHSINGGGCADCVPVGFS